MREELKLLLSDKVHRSGAFLAIASVVFGLIFFLVTVRNLPPVVPLFYHRPWGLPQLGSSWHLILLLVSSLGVLLLNLTLAMKLYKSVILLSRILLWIAALCCLLATTTVVRIIVLMT